MHAPVRRCLAAGFLVALSLARGTARADTPVTAAVDTPIPAPDLRAGAPVDVDPHRNFAIEVTPLSLFLSHIGAGIELMPIEHHVLLASAYYFSTRTAPTTAHPDITNDFHGIGGELGYRYYWGSAGPRGLFVGPSLVLGKLQAVPTYGDSVPFWNYGLAADAGYQAILGDAWVFGMSVGAQYTRVSESFANQEAPATYHANSGLHPRVQLAIGYAFNL